MKFGKSRLIFVTSFLLVCSFKICAQAPLELFGQTSKSSLFIQGKTVINEIKIVGADADGEYYDQAIYGAIIRESRILGLFQDKNVNLYAGQKFDAEKVGRAIVALKKWLADLGYWEADVTAMGDSFPKNRMNLIFSIKRHSVSRVSEIHFIGNEIFTGEELAGLLRNCFGNSWGIFNKLYLQYCVSRDVRTFMFSRGYFKATAELLSTRFINSSFVITIGVKEGTRFRIGKIMIEGVKVFTRDEILTMMGQQEGDIADGQKLQDFLYEKLKETYSNKGYMLYNAEFDPQFIKPLADGLDGIINLLVTIDEGQRVKFTGIHFRGVSKEENEKLIESFPLKKGDFFSKSEFEKGIEVINRTGKFMPIDIDRDVDIKTVEKFSGINISRLNDVKLNEEPEDAFWVVSLREHD